jgi:hypothetical protein
MDIYGHIYSEVEEKIGEKLYALMFNDKVVSRGELTKKSTCPIGN